jgi:hypothetical protein
MLTSVLRQDVNLRGGGFSRYKNYPLYMRLFVFHLKFHAWNLHDTDLQYYNWDFPLGTRMGTILSNWQNPILIYITNDNQI